MTMTQLLGPRATSTPNSSISGTVVASGATSQTSKLDPQPSSSSPISRKMPTPTMDALRLMDLSDRTSAVMYGSVTAELLHRDPLVAALRTFARLHRVPVTTAALSVIPQEEFPAKICERAEETNADLVLLPWNTSLHPVVEVVSATRQGEGTSYNPFEGVFSKGSNAPNVSSERPGAVGYAQFVRKVFSLSIVDVALFLENDGSGAPAEGEAEEERKPLQSGHSIFFPFSGGPDDRLALDLVVQLCGNADNALQATVVRIIKTEPPEAEPETDSSKPPATEEIEAANMLTVKSGTNALPDTIYAAETTQHRLASETADNLAWNRFVNRSPGATAFPPEVESALRRITFTEVSSPTPLAACISQMADIVQKEQEAAKQPDSGGACRNLLIVVGRGRRLATESHHDELKNILSETGGNTSRIHMAGDTRKTLGDAGAAFLAAGPPGASMLVMQAAHQSADV